MSTPNDHDIKVLNGLIENGEDHIKAKYEKAIEDRDLSATTRDTVTRAYGSVREGHDQMRDIKHAMQAKS